MPATWTHPCPDPSSLRLTTPGNPSNLSPAYQAALRELMLGTPIGAREAFISVIATYPDLTPIEHIALFAATTERLIAENWYKQPVRLAFAVRISDHPDTPTSLLWLYALIAAESIARIGLHKPESPAEPGQYMLPWSHSDSTNSWRSELTPVQFAWSLLGKIANHDIRALPTPLLTFIGQLSWKYLHDQSFLGADDALANVADFPNCPTHLLARAAWSRFAHVRAAVSLNPAAPEDLRVIAALG